MLSESDLVKYNRASLYTFWTTEKIRYSDLDTNRHVNNAIYISIVECARIEFRATTTKGLGVEGWVIAAQTIRYLKPSQYPGELRIGTGVVSIGRTSFVLAYGVFQDEICVAVASTRSVCVDDDGKPAILPEQLRGVLESYKIEL